MPVREIDVAVVRDTIEQLCLDANYELPENVVSALTAAKAREVSPIGKQTISHLYYVGSAPAKPDQPIGPAGPTTSSRMDRFAPTLYAAGVKATIGKGYRTAPVVEAIARHTALYLAAIGGSGALLSQRIVSSEIVAFPELGPEAIYRLEVRDFPAIVINDARGADLYQQARLAWQELV